MRPETSDWGGKGGRERKWEKGKKARVAGVESSQKVRWDEAARPQETANEEKTKPGRVPDDANRRGRLVISEGKGLRADTTVYHVTRYSVLDGLLDE